MPAGGYNLRPGPRTSEARAARKEMHLDAGNGSPTHPRKKARGQFGPIDRDTAMLLDAEIRRRTPLGLRLPEEPARSARESHGERQQKRKGY